MAFTFLERLGRPSGPGMLLPLWLLAAYVFVASPFFVFFQLAESDRTLQQRAVASLEKSLPGIIEQGDIPDTVRRAVATLLQSDSLWLNYLTLRNADGVVLLSRGRLSGAQESAGARSRQWRAYWYRWTSSDHQLELNRDAGVVGYAEYGVALQGIVTHALPRAWLPLALGLLSFVLLFYLSPRLILALAERIRSRQSTRRPARRVARRRPADAARVAPEPAELLSADGLATLADQMRIGLLLIARDGRVIQGNVTAARCLGSELRRLKGLDAVDALSLFDRQGRHVDSPLSLCLSGGESRAAASGWLRRRDQTPYGVELQIAAASLPDGAACLALIFDQDDKLRRSREVEDRALLAETLLRLSDTPVAVTDARGRLGLVNTAWAHSFGYSPEALKDLPLSRLLTDPFEPRDLSARSNAPGQAVHRDGHGFPVQVSVSDCLWEGRDGHLLRILPAPDPSVAATDLPDVRIGSQGMPAGLAGRPVLMQQITRALGESSAGAGLMLAVVDLRGFRQVNLEHGRDTGDRLLTRFAEALKQVLPNALATVGLGGDEFAVLLRQAEDEHTEASLERLGNRLQQAATDAFTLDGHALPVPLDIGVSTLPQDAQDGETLLAHAEVALYAAKRDNTGQPTRYEADQTQASSTGDGAARTLRRALEENDMTLVMRPIEAAASPGVIAAAYAEPEWAACPQGPLSGPALWAQARQAGIDADLGGWCLQQIVRGVVDWQSLELAQVPIILRVPAEVATAPGFARAWELARTRFNLSPEISLLWFDQDAVPDPASLPAGFRLAADCSPDSPPPENLMVHCVGGDAVSGLPDKLAAFDRCKALLARAETAGARLLVGPVEAEPVRQALAGMGRVYVYGDLVGRAVPPRAFGRRLARQGGQSI